MILIWFSATKETRTVRILWQLITWKDVYQIESILKNFFQLQAVWTSWCGNSKGHDCKLQVILALRGSCANPEKVCLASSWVQWTSFRRLNMEPAFFTSLVHSMSFETRQFFAANSFGNRSSLLGRHASPSIHWPNIEFNITTRTIKKIAWHITNPTNLVLQL